MASWSEPFSRVICGNVGSPAFRHIGHIFIVQSQQEHLLSGKALAAVGDKLSQDETNFDQLGWGWEKETELKDGSVSTLLDLSLDMLSQSYELACTKYNEPQLAISAIQLLCLMTKKFPESDAKEMLLRIGNDDQLAQSRILRYAIVYNAVLPSLSVDSRQFIGHLLYDLRTLVERKMHHHVENLIHCVAGPIGSVIDMTSSLHDMLEILYLIAEHLFSTRNFVRLVKLPDLFSSVWNATERREEDEYKKERRRVQACIARAHEAMGKLDLAKTLYREIEYKESARDLDKYLSGQALYWSQQSKTSISGKTNGLSIDARELNDGSIAVFTTCSDVDGNDVHVGFFTVFPGSEFQLKTNTLPHGGRNWSAAKVIPGSKQEPLRLLVAPKRPVLNGDSHANAMSETMEKVFDSLRGNSAPFMPMELWERRGLEWRQVSLKGNIPDRKVVIGSCGGSHCVRMEGFVVLFSGFRMFQRSSSNDNGVFLLNLQTREWFQVPHPYASSFYANEMSWESVPPGAINYSLPRFSSVSLVKTGGGEAIALLRNGKPIKNKKGGNELVPKRALDLLFATAETPLLLGANRPIFWWHQDIPTLDRSGYIANELKNASVSIGQYILLISSKTHNMVEKAESDGTTKFDFEGYSNSSVTTDVLDIENLEWRGTSIRNSWLLNDTNYELLASVMIKNQDSACCYLIQKSSSELRLLCLHNTNAFESCLKAQVSEKKKLSKKMTLSYQIRKAEKTQARPMRMCAYCKIFEASGVTFGCCSQCSKLYYCSKKCQRQHWKEGHKGECLPASD